MAPQTRGGKGKGRKQQTKETTTTSKNLRTTTSKKPKNFKPRKWYIDVEELSDDYVPERKTVMAYCKKRKEESKIESKREFKALITYLKKKGMPAERTYEEAIHQLFGGGLSPTMKKLISERIGKYIALRLTNIARILAEILGVCDWDNEVVSLIIELTEDLKELVVSVPELEEIISFAADVLKANERWQVRMGEAMKERVRLWLLNSMNEVEMMKKWAKCPTSIIESGFKFGR